MKRAPVLAVRLERGSGRRRRRGLELVAGDLEELLAWLEDEAPGEFGQVDVQAPDWPRRRVSS